MTRELPVALVANETDSAEFVTGVAHAETGLSIETVVPPSVVAREAVDFGDVQCVILVGDDDRPSVQNMYEQIRIAYPAYPIVVVSPYDDREFIDHVLADQKAEFAYLSEDSIPFTSIGVRCRMLLNEPSVA